MPPKKASARGGKKAKGPKSAKGKKGGKDAKKGKKMKKGYKKFAGLMFDDQYIWDKNRGELEVIAMTLVEQLEIERGERICMTYERDWLFEMSQVYLNKIRNVRKSSELKFVQVNRGVQDLEERKLYNRLSKKQFLYSTLMRTSAIELRDEKRFKRLRKLVPLTWKFTYLENEEHDARIALLPKQRAARRKHKAASLETLESRLKRIYNEAAVFAGIFDKAVNKMLVEIKYVSKAELLNEFDTTCRVMASSHSTFTLAFSILKNYLIDMTQNILTVIMSILDHWEDMDADGIWRLAHRKLYDVALLFMEKRLVELRSPFALKRIQTIEYARAVTGLDTTYKSIRVSEFYLKAEMKIFRNTIKEFHMYQRSRNVVNLDISFVGDELMIAYGAPRYGISELQEEYDESIIDHVYAKKEFVYLYGEAAVEEYWMWRGFTEIQQEHVFDKHYAMYRDLKIHDDYYNSVRARLERIGVFERDHVLEFGDEHEFGFQPVFMVGREHGLSSTPAALLANAKGFPQRPRTPPHYLPLRPCDDQDNEIFGQKNIVDVLEFLYG